MTFYDNKEKKDTKLKKVKFRETPETKNYEIEENEVINYKTDEDAVKDSETTELEHTILVEKTSAVEESSHDTLDYDRNLQCTDAEGEPAVDGSYIL